MVVESHKLLVDYLVKLAKKKKIVLLRDVGNDESTPKHIKNSLWGGNTSNKLMHYYAYKKGLRVMVNSFGSVRAQRVAVFMDKNEKYINTAMQKHDRLVKQYHKIKDKLDKKEKEIRDLEI